MFFFPLWIPGAVTVSASPRAPDLLKSTLFWLGTSAVPNHSEPPPAAPIASSDRVTSSTERCSARASSVRPSRFVHSSFYTVESACTSVDAWIRKPSCAFPLQKSQFTAFKNNNAIMLKTKNPVRSGARRYSVAMTTNSYLLHWKGR